MKTENIDWKDKYPLNTFAGETRRELTAFIESIIKERDERLVEEVERLGWNNYNTEYSKGYYGAKEDILSILKQTK